jgi:hypothetical protein
MRGNTHLHSRYRPHTTTASTASVRPSVRTAMCTYVPWYTCERAYVLIMLCHTYTCTYGRTYGRSNTMVLVPWYGTIPRGSYVGVLLIVWPYLCMYTRGSQCTCVPIRKL